MDKKDMLDQITLKSLLNYNEGTGAFNWISGNGKTVKAGDLAGYLDSRGYIVIKYKRAYTAHRLAWLYAYGNWPKNQIDHINGIRNDNRINNLREVTLQENGRNRIEHRGGHLVGSSFSNRDKIYRAQIQVNKVKIHLGNYKTKEEAHAAYMSYLNKEKLK